MIIKLTHAHMHGTLHVPTLNKQLGTTLDEKGYPGIQMHRLDNGDVAVSYAGTKFILPSVNFKVLVIDQAEQKEEKAKKEKQKEEK